MPREVAKVENTGRTIIPRFHNPGDKFTGLLLGNPTKREAKDMEGNPKTWSDGTPVFEYVYEFLNVETSAHPESCHYCKLRDSEDDFENDNGFRRLYASGKQHKVIQEAVRAQKNAQGQNELYGPLTLTYSHDDKDKKQPGRAAPKVFTASYAIPSDEEVARVDEFNGVGTPVVHDEDNEPLMSFEDLLGDDMPGKKMSLEDMKNVK